MSKFIFDCKMSKCQAPSPRAVGQKARNLFILKRHFPVPEFVVVNTKAFKDYRKYGKLIPEIENELRKILENFLREGTVAIRSSGSAEDLPGVSFAGMYATTLNITNINGGIAAVINTWNSIDSQRVREYRRQMNIPAGDMAVIIQHQLKSEISGVMVTQSPFSVTEILIECCSGLGEKLVSGRLTPTRYRVSGERIFEHKGENLLSKDQVIELVKIGKRIEKIFKSPQDIEWTIEDGQIYLLQSRPIIVRASTPRRKCTVWCNANVRETIPEPMSPMGYSIFGSVFFPGILLDAFGIPISEELYNKYRPVELLSGRLYWNLNNTMAYSRAVGYIVNTIEGDRAIDPQMAAAIRSVDIKTLPKPISGIKLLGFSIVSFIRVTHYVLISFIRYKSMADKIRKSNVKFNAIYENLVPVRDLIEGVKNIRNWVSYVIKGFARRYFGGLFLSILLMTVLGKILSIRLGKKGDMIARKTILGIIDKTGEMALALNNLAGLARAKLKNVSQRNLKRLYACDLEFKAKFDSFINDFGHRGPAEFDIAGVNWREDHNMVFKMIETARESKEYRIDRKAMIDDLLRSSRPLEKFVLKLFLPRIEVFTPFRENGKHVYLKSMAKTKDQLCNIEEILLDQGYLIQKRDIYFLTMDDLDDIVAKQRTKTSILNLVKERKREWEIYKKTPAPDIIHESGERITQSVDASNLLEGEPLSFGKIKAKARIIRNFKESNKLREGEILVTHHTDPGWTPLFTVAAGVIIEVGGVICHAAMVARELGVPAVVVRGATSLLHDGQIVELDADMGRCLTF